MTAHPDEVLLVVAEQPGRGVRQPGQVGEEDVEVGGLLGDGLAGDRDVVEDVEQVGRRHVVGVGDLGQRLEVLAQGRQVVLDPADVVAELVHRLAEVLAAPLERGRQRVQRGVEVGRLDRLEQREQVGEHPAQLDVGLDPVGRDDVAVLERSRGVAVRADERDELLAEERGRHDVDADVRRDLLGGVGVERERDLGLLAVWSILSTRPTSTPLIRTSPNLASCRPARSALTLTVVTLSKVLL